MLDFHMCCIYNIMSEKVELGRWRGLKLDQGLTKLSSMFIYLGNPPPTPNPFPYPPSNKQSESQERSLLLTPC